MNAKALLAKSWKNEDADLAPGRHCVEEEFVVRITGTVEKCDDEISAPTVSIPLIAVLALFWEKCGIVREHALNMLRQALQEAMTAKVKEDKHIKDRIKDVDEAVKAIRQDLIASLPEMHREGKLLVDGLQVEVLPMEPAAVPEFGGELVAA
jgi:acyl carrier protein phosphodiesterase